MASSENERPHKRTTVQLSADAMARVDQAASQTGLTRPRVLEHLVLRASLRDLVRLLKAEKPEPSRPGRPKQSVFQKAGMAGPAKPRRPATGD